MLRALKAALALLCLVELASSRRQEMIWSRQKLSEVTNSIQRLTSRAQVPCNDTRVAQIIFTGGKPSDYELLLCQAATVLAKVTRCRKDYEPLIVNLKSLHSTECGSLSTDNEIYLRNFLPELGNFTQALYRWHITSTLPTAPGGPHAGSP